MVQHKYVAAAALIGCLMAQSLAAEGTTGWRGDGHGKYPEATPPTAWGPQQNVVWQVAMPAIGNAAPILVGDRLFVCAEPTTLVAVNEADGKLLWQHGNEYRDVLAPAEVARVDAECKEKLPPLQEQAQDLDAKVKEANQRFEQSSNAKIREDLQKAREEAKAQPKDTALRDRVQKLQKDEQASRSKDLGTELNRLRRERDGVQQKMNALDVFRKPPTHDVNGYTSPTPISDGTRVYVLFGTGVAAAYALDGERVWARVIERPTHGWGHSASPVLAGGKLIVHLNQTVRALDPATGTELWATRSGSMWATPAVGQCGADVGVVTAAGDLIRVRDGKVMASKLVALPWSSPVAEGDVLYVVDEAGAKAVKLPTSLADGVAAPQVLWQMQPKKDRYYATPLINQGLVYNVNQQGWFSVIDAATGALVHERKLDFGGGTIFPSIVLAGSQLFASSENGTTLILTANRECPEVGRNRLEPFRSTPIFRGHRMYVRTQKHLYCLGQ